MSEESNNDPIVIDMHTVEMLLAGAALWLVILWAAVKVCQMMGWVA